jgi:hypothetical protein
MHHLWCVTVVRRLLFARHDSQTHTVIRFTVVPLASQGAIFFLGVKCMQELNMRQEEPPRLYFVSVKGSERNLAGMVANDVKTVGAAPSGP